jgi:hypothetical protein
MRHFRIICLAILFSIIPTNSFADTYQLFPLQNENDVIAIVGIDTIGAATLLVSFPALDCNTNPGGTPMGPCYATYVNGVLTSASVTAPIIVDHGGGPVGAGCPAIPSYIPPSAISINLCVNGHQFYSVTQRFLTNPNTGTTIRTGLYNGPDTTLDYVGGSLPTNVARLVAAENSYGDIVFEDIGAEEVYEIYDLTTHAAVPEPATLSLMAAGVLAAAKTIRRSRNPSR